jgi:hypothetical protein
MKNTYNTHLASEFYVLSALYRLGYDATLTLSNKKDVDIIVSKNKYQITLDVKGSISASSYRLSHISRPNHFYVFLSFHNKIDDLDTIPEIFIVPSVKIKNILNPTSKDEKVNYTALRAGKNKYTWALLNSYFNQIG